MLCYLALIEVHFVSHFSPPGVTSRWQSLIRKPFHARQIGPDMEASQRAKHDVGRGPPKVSYRCSLIVHYRQPECRSRFACRARVTTIWARAEARGSIFLAMRWNLPVNGVNC